MRAAMQRQGVAIARRLLAPQQCSKPCSIAATGAGRSRPRRSASTVCGASPKEFKADLRSGALRFGVFLNSGSYLASELLSHAGWDWVLVDLQHSAYTYDQLGAMLAGADTGGAATLVRVGGPNDRTGMQQALDLGAAGVMVPSVETPEEVEAAVGYCRYPPEGVRSIFYPMRPAHRTGLAPYLEDANTDVLVAIQVETAACLNQLEAVLSVPGVDCAFVGPIDLAFSMGLHQKYGLADMYGSREFQEAMEHVLAVCAAKGVIPGNFAFPATQAPSLAEAGFQLLAVGTDLGLLLAASSGQFEGLAGLRGPDGNTWAPRPSAIT